MHVDVLIVGAGLSGVGAACHLRTHCPNRTVAILEGRDNIGGTWDLFRYPGIRSDSDMHTLGYSFRPWTDAKAIADGPSILQYVNDTADAYGIRSSIHFGHKVRRASWSSASRRWTVHATCDGEDVTFTCGFLYMCSGYYRYEHGHVPDFEGQSDFAGRVVHPQHWPEDLNTTDQRIVVIGSGATAVTLVPTLAKTAAHVTMLQRSPTYVVAFPREDAIANRLNRWLPAAAAYRLTRTKNVSYTRFVNAYQARFPDRVKARILSLAEEHLPRPLIDAHFTPTYNPGEQRICLAPDGDLFAAIRSGAVQVVTQTIRRFVPDGIELDDGVVLHADLIVTATGLDLLMLGGVDFEIDGKTVNFAESFAYKGFAYSGVPNLASTFGYVNASWTLRADLIATYVCRMLNHMDATNTAVCTPHLSRKDRNMTARPFIEGFTPNYMKRVMDRFPHQGEREPWTNVQDYANDRRIFLKQPVDDGVMQFK